MWGLFKPYINIQNIVGDSYVLTWSAKWLGSDEIEYSSLGMTSRKNMITEIYKLLEEADAVVTFNGDNFDLRILNMEFLMLGLPPPAPYKSIDLLKTVKRRFRGTSNKLNYWLKKLDIGEKVQHRGLQLWIDCMNGDKGSFEEMIEYNIGDVVELEGFYQKLVPWIPNHPNMSVHYGELVCTHCGSDQYQRRGYAVTTAGKYARCQCKTCGGWFRSTQSEAAEERFVAL